MSSRGVLIRGIAAGLIGGGAVAIWFLLIDSSQGVPFRTPGLIASRLAGRQSVEVTPVLVGLYSAIHFSLFASVGAVMAWLVDRLPVSSGSLLGLVLGFLAFDVLFYGGPPLMGVDIVQELGWPEVLGGNLIGGLLIVGFVHLSVAAKPAEWWYVLDDPQARREGLLVGLTGAASVMLWFLIFDLLRGEPLRTPAAIGSALFLGAANVQQIDVTVVTVGGYLTLHVAVFTLAGLIASALVRQATDGRPFVLGGIVTFVALEAVFLGILAVVAEFLLEALSWWVVAGSNALATLAMGALLWRWHPVVRDVPPEPSEHRSAAAA